MLPPRQELRRDSVSDHRNLEHMLLHLLQPRPPPKRQEPEKAMFLGCHSGGAVLAALSLGQGYHCTPAAPSKPPENKAMN